MLHYNMITIRKMNEKQMGIQLKKRPYQRIRKERWAKLKELKKEK